MCTVGILLCAGASCRMGFHKLTTPLCGRSAVERSMDALLAGGCDALVFAVSDSTKKLAETLNVPVPHRLVNGGRTRQDSVHIALIAGRETFQNAEIAVIHDAARCLVSPETVRACIESACEFGSGIAAMHSADTVLMREGSSVRAVDRDALVVMQTPQVFRYADILTAYEKADGTATDDCTLYARAGFDPQFVPGGRNNFKLTSPEDWAMAEAMLTRCGTGFDTHRLVEGRKLILGGVEIPYEKGLLGHSDADVLTHAVIDALLGAASLGDIGKLFPDTDERFRGIDSLKLLTETVRRIRKKGMYPVHIDATIIAERPKLAPHIEGMRDRLSAAIGIAREFVSVKATTTEGMNDEGRGLCISAQAVASIR